MASYPDIPDWGFLLFLVVTAIAQVFISVYTPFKMPVWGIFLAILLSFAFLLPIGVISALTGIDIGLNILTELVIGLIIPGQTIAVLCFRSLGTNMIIQAIALLADLKLGHYMKINPVHVCMAQVCEAHYIDSS